MSEFTNSALSSKDPKKAPPASKKMDLSDEAKQQVADAQKQFQEVLKQKKANANLWKAASQRIQDSSQAKSNDTVRIGNSKLTKEGLKAKRNCLLYYKEFEKELGKPPTCQTDQAWIDALEDARLTVSLEDAKDSMKLSLALIAMTDVKISQQLGIKLDGWEKFLLTKLKKLWEFLFWLLCLMM